MEFTPLTSSSSSSSSSSCNAVMEKDLLCRLSPRTASKFEDLSVDVELSLGPPMNMHHHTNLKKCGMCGTVNTPMWRNGPQGSKTACNACGIRYRKEEQRLAMGLTLGGPSKRNTREKSKLSRSTMMNL